MSKFKTSWDYIRQADRVLSKKYFRMVDDGGSNEQWRDFPDGKEWCVIGTNGNKSQWYRRIEGKGRIPIKEPDWYKEKVGAVPWFCPKCDKPMKRKEDSKYYNRKGYCFNCHLAVLAENELKALKLKAKLENNEQYSKTKTNR